MRKIRWVVLFGILTVSFMEKPVVSLLENLLNKSLDGEVGVSGCGPRS